MRRYQDLVDGSSAECEAALVTAPSTGYSARRTGGTERGRISVRHWVDDGGVARLGTSDRGRVLALIIAVGVLLATLAAFDPTTLRPGWWTTSFYGTIAFAALLGTALWRFGRSFSDSTMASAVVVIEALIVLSVLANQDRAGGLLNIVLLLPPTLFASLYLSSKWVRTQEAFALLCCAATTAYIADSPIQWLSLTLVPGLALICAAEVVLLQRRQLSVVLSVLESAAITDPLTGLLNRRGLEDMATARAKPTCATYRALLVVDIDLFKNINDSFGHAVGDEVLRTLSRALRDSVRADDLIVRMGGEEFVILSQVALPDVRAFAERIRLEAQRAMAPWSATISIGVVHTAAADGVPLTAATVDQLMEAADRCLYQAKRDGRNRVVAAQA